MRPAGIQIDNRFIITVRFRDIATKLDLPDFRLKIRRIASQRDYQK